MSRLHRILVTVISLIIIVLYLYFPTSAVALEKNSFYTTVFNKSNLSGLVDTFENIGINYMDAGGILLNPDNRHTLEQSNMKYINHDLLPMIVQHGCQRAGTW